MWAAVCNNYTSKRSHLSLFIPVHRLFFKTNLSYLQHFSRAAYFDCLILRWESWAPATKTDHVCNNKDSSCSPNLDSSTYSGCHQPILISLANVNGSNGTTNTDHSTVEPFSGNLLMVTFISKSVDSNHWSAVIFTHSHLQGSKRLIIRRKKYLLANSHVDIKRQLQAGINLEYTFGLLHGTGPFVEQLHCLAVATRSGLCAFHCLTGHSWPSLYLWEN